MARCRRRKNERGFALLLVFLMAAIIGITLYMEVPRVAMQSQRDKEQALIDRGEQYKRAIQLFVAKAKRYPGDIKELESFQNQRFLRQRYIDPMTGKDEWRLIHIQGGVLTDSKVTKPTAPGGKEEPKGPNGFVGEQAGMGALPNQTQGGGAAGARERRRPSDGNNGTMPGPAAPGGDLAGAARRILPYLPERATIHAKVFPVIKPQTNSFVWDLKSDPTIFLYLDPAISQEKFENTVAHEMHHIGFSTVEHESESRYKDLPANVKETLEWMGGFGEGFAMLAAAGSPDVHPHAASSAEERERWDHDMANFNQDLKTVEKFFLDILDGRLKTEQEMNEVGSSFFGVQGPWYTVGYKIAVVIEKRYGRAVLIDCMQDPRLLILRYNAAASDINKSGKETLVLWSPELVHKIGTPP